MYAFVCGRNHIIIIEHHRHRQHTSAVYVYDGGGCLCMPLYVVETNIMIVVVVCVSCLYQGYQAAHKCYLCRDGGGCLCIMPLYVAETIITIGIKKAYTCTEVNSHSTVH